jgi:pimeloyl-ACP methyl ester carboxylesterase
VNTVATRHEVLTLDDLRFLFFAPSPASRAAGERFWERRHQRVIDVNPSTSRQTVQAQAAAIVDWKLPHGDRFADLKTITQPTLVVNGHRDIVVPTIWHRRRTIGVWPFGGQRSPVGPYPLPATQPQEAQP